MNFKNERGLTLIEVLLSITILGIVATSFLSFFNQAYSYTKMNEDKTVGINVARNVLYFFEQLDFDTIKDKINSNPPELILTNCSELSGIINEGDCNEFLKTKINNVEYTSTVTFSNFEDKSGTDLDYTDLLISVEVTVEGNNQTSTVRGLIKK